MRPLLETLATTLTLILALIFALKVVQLLQLLLSDCHVCFHVTKKLFSKIQICRRIFPDSTNDALLAREIHSSTIVYDSDEIFTKGYGKASKELEERARRIEKQAILNKSEMQNQGLQLKWLCGCIMKEMWKAMKLAEKHQKEKEKRHEKFMAMKKKLNETQVLELEIEKLKGDTTIMKDMLGGDADAELIEKIANTQINLEARETNLHEKLSTLAKKIYATNDEYQEARKALIQEARSRGCRIISKTNSLGGINVMASAPKSKEIFSTKR